MVSKNKQTDSSVQRMIVGLTEFAERLEGGEEVAKGFATKKLSVRDDPSECTTEPHDNTRDPSAGSG